MRLREEEIYDECIRRWYKGHVPREMDMQNHKVDIRYIDQGKICTRSAQLRLEAEYVVQAKPPDQRQFR